MPTTEDPGRLGDPGEAHPFEVGAAAVARYFETEELTRQNDGADRSDSIYSTRENQCEASGVL